MPVDTAHAQTAAALLAWYDASARTLPWRALPDAPPTEPYRVWLSEIMLQQTTVAAVIPYFERFTARWPTVEALAAADDGAMMAAWAGLGYYSRARNLIACARVLVKLGGFPTTEAELRALPGIGTYTAAAIAAIAFGKRAVVVDGNVERVVARLFAVATSMPSAKPELRALADRLTPAMRSGDHAQAMMDLGATVCRPRTPDCPHCPVAHACAARASGDPARYPVKLPKAAKPVRQWTAWWIVDDERVLLVRRPSTGLLGGMLALPVTEASGDGPPFARIAHVFTHFTLDLHIIRAPTGFPLPPNGEWWDIAALADAGLPSVFLKAARAALEASP